MDPISQAVVGVVAAQNVSLRSELKWATLFGALSGMAPDLDVLISSKSDPLVFFEYHRHFTHSLAFIPLGALICALIFKLIFKGANISLKNTYIYCLAGFATHGLLDTCTSYGTQLLWPFSDIRISWDNISIIDPIFTFPLIITTMMVLLYKNKKFAKVAFIFAISYLLMGRVQNIRAKDVAHTLIEQRGHTTATKLSVKPSFANLVLWKSIYEYQGRFYVDAIRVGLSKSKITPGESVAKFNVQRDMPWLKEGTTQYTDIKRFHWFSDGYIALVKDNKYQITDIRYSPLPHQINGMWGIELNPQAKDHQHAQRYSARRGVSKKDLKSNFKDLWSMILGP